MTKEYQNPKAFISCSLRNEDKPVVDWLTNLTRIFGFVPFGTVGKFTATPKPIYEEMKLGIKDADCLILFATPRYIQDDIHLKKRTGKGISEMLHVEVGMAVASDKPVLVFVQKGTSIGSFISNLVQYIEIDPYNQQDIINKWPLIANYFRSALSIIAANWEKNKNKENIKTLQTILTIIGGAVILNSLLSDDKE
ncbi:hypothetical protein [Leptospira santarosai]|uniref:TIR domain-containing protein n=1 Tax=Leptospira santarosai str. ZUN179 TaxID=1049985 RepID=M6UWY4_9LEPT|nr:hypothetical protein [Leptospira santarosai]EMO47266.1 hypothetical protein LEP1GSC187_0004 [Leptospira santarosai str. ZUN179]